MRKELMQTANNPYVRRILLLAYIFLCALLVFIPSALYAQLDTDNPEFTDPTRFPQPVSPSVNPLQEQRGELDGFAVPGPPAAPQERSPFIPCGDIVDAKGKVTNPCNACHLIQLSQNILRFFVLSLAIPAAAVLIAYGGALMVFSPASPGQHSRGVKIIKNALLGLFFIFASWVIIDSVMKLAGARIIAGVQDPDFRPWNVIECTVPKGETRGTPTTGSTPRLQPTFQDTRITGDLLTNEGALQMIKNGRMKVVSSGNCFDRLRSDCSSFEGFPEQGMNELVRLNEKFLKTCPTCAGFTLTGGTEVGHKTHGVGKSIVDISSKDARVNAFIRSETGVSSPQINTWYKGGDNHYYFYERDHWHVCLTPTCKPHHVEGD